MTCGAKNSRDFLKSIGITKCIENKLPECEAKAYPLA
jgi:hypothetical protein